MLLGVFSGLISGLLGVGGGTVLVPALALIFSFPQSEAQGSALLAMLLPSVAKLEYDAFDAHFATDLFTI